MALRSRDFELDYTFLDDEIIYVDSQEEERKNEPFKYESICCWYCGGLTFKFDGELKSHDGIAVCRGCLQKVAEPQKIPTALDKQIDEQGFDYRGHFAALAMQAILSQKYTEIARDDYSLKSSMTNRHWIADVAVEQADALISRLKKEGL